MDKHPTRGPEHPDHPERPEQAALRALRDRVALLNDIASDESATRGERLRALELLALIAELSKRGAPPPHSDRPASKHATKKHPKKHASKHAASKHTKQHAASKRAAKKHSAKHVESGLAPRRLTDGRAPASRRLGSGS